MRNKAIGAVLYSFFYVLKISSAFVPKRIEGAVAEKAVEKLLVFCLVAGEIYTVFILEIRKIVVHKKRLLNSFFNVIISC